MIARILVIALLFAALVGPALPSRAAEAYLFKIITTADPVYFRAVEKGNVKNAGGVRVAANASNVTYLVKAATYDLTFELCGKIVTHVWSGVGNGVKITVQGCNSFSFKQE